MCVAESAHLQLFIRPVGGGRGFIFVSFSLGNRFVGGTVDQDEEEMQDFLSAESLAVAMVPEKALLLVLEKVLLLVLEKDFVSAELLAK